MAKPPARSPVYDPPLIMVRGSSPVEELEAEVRDFPHPNKDVEGFFEMRHRALRNQDLHHSYEEWTKKDEKLRAAKPELYDNCGNLIEVPQSVELPDGN